MKISKLQKKIGQFTLQIEELYLESGKVHGLRNQWLRKNNSFQADTGDIGSG